MVVRTAPAYGKTQSIRRLAEPLVIANPYPFYTNLSRQGSLFWDQEAKSWICTGYEDAEFILRDPQAHFGLIRFRSTEQLQERGLDNLVPTYILLRPHMILQDDPLHNQVRARIQHHCKKIAKGSFPADVQTLIEEQLMPFIHEHYRVQMDFIDDFAGMLPTKVAALLLGLPLEDVPHFLRWNSAYGDALASLVGPVQLRLPTQSGMLETLDEALHYFQYMVQMRLRSPQNDLISDMVQVLLHSNERIAPEVIINIVAAYCMLLLSDGHATATNLMFQALLWISKKPELRHQLEEDPKRWDDFLTETGRLSSPCQYIARQALQDSVISGKRIRRGQTIVVLIAAANRDEQAFLNASEWIMNRQSTHKPLALGLSRHPCLDAPHTELALRTAIYAFLHAFPDFQFAPEEELEWQGSLNARCPIAIPLSVTSVDAKTSLASTALNLAVPEHLALHVQGRELGWQNDIVEVSTFGEGVVIRYNPAKVQLSFDLQQGVLLAHKMSEASIESTPDTDKLVPRDPAQCLQEIFGRVLSAERIDENSDFFDAGGDSLALLELLLEIEKHFQIKLDPLVVYEYPRLVDLAYQIVQQPKASVSEPEPEAVHS